MSVTVEDLMRLPSLRQAKVIGGSGGMRRVVSSISVLESTKPEILVNELFPDTRSGYSGGELVITGFINCTDDVEMQCENVRRLIEGGEVGLVLYYVGVYLPRVDQRLIDMADENDFVLICMPEGKSNLRYGELITDVTECIYQDKSSASLVSDILDRMSSAPRSQQTVATALRMLCMELGCSIVLGSMDGVLLELATWPSELEDTVRKGLEPYLPFPFERGSVRCNFMPDAVAYCQTIRSDSGERYQLALVRVGMPLEKGELEQAADTLRICINIWGRQSGTDAVNELVRAILQDEPLRMRRLAGIFHIDIASIHELWLFCGTDAGKVKKHMKEYCELMRQYADTVFGAVFEGIPVMCLSTPHSQRETEKVMMGVIADMRAVWPDTVIVRCCGLNNTTDCRRAYLTVLDALEDVRNIFPDRCLVLQGELEFASECRKLIDGGEDAAMRSLAPLTALQSDSESGDLLETVCTYLLDCDGSVTKTAGKLFLHRNTIKYRLQRITDMLGHHPAKMPEMMGLYRSAAVYRLLVASKET